MGTSGVALPIVFGIDPALHVIAEMNSKLSRSIRLDSAPVPAPPVPYYELPRDADPAK